MDYGYLSLWCCRSGTGRSGPRVYSVRHLSNIGMCAVCLKYLPLMIDHVLKTHTLVLQGWGQGLGSFRATSPEFYNFTYYKLDLSPPNLPNVPPMVAHMCTRATSHLIHQGSFAARPQSATNWRSSSRSYSF